MSSTQRLPRIDPDAERILGCPAPVRGRALRKSWLLAGASHGAGDRAAPWGGCLRRISSNSTRRGGLA